MHPDALLWAADAIAWCWQHGGKWKDRVMPLIAHSIDAAADSAKPGPPA